MKYYINFKVSAYYIAEVEADDIAKAIEIGKKEYSEADFGEAVEIDGHIMSVEDNRGRVIYEA